MKPKTISSAMVLSLLTGLTGVSQRLISHQKVMFLKKFIVVITSNLFNHHSGSAVVVGSTMSCILHQTMHVCIHISHCVWWKLWLPKFTLTCLPSGVPWCVPQYKGVVCIWSAESAACLVTV